MNIYVGNLSYQTDDYALEDHFSQYGEVLRARVVTDRDTGRHRGFGFVEMASAEAGQKAIDALDGQEHLGRQLKINEARPRDIRGGGGGGGRRSYSSSRY